MVGSSSDDLNAGRAGFARSAAKVFPQGQTPCSKNCSFSTIKTKVLANSVECDAKAESSAIQRSFSISNRVITALMTAASLSTMYIASSIFAFWSLGGRLRLDMRETDEAFEVVRNKPLPF